MFLRLLQQPPSLLWALPRTRATLATFSSKPTTTRSRPRVAGRRSAEFASRARRTECARSSQRRCRSNRLASLRLRQARSSKADDDGVVASEPRLIRTISNNVLRTSVPRNSNTGHAPLLAGRMAPLSARIFGNVCVWGSPIPAAILCRISKRGHSNLTPVRHRSLLAARGARPGDCLL